MSSRTYFYFGLDTFDSASACLSSHPPELKGSTYRLDDGEPLAGWFPANARYPMSRHYPNARKLNDLQNNTLEIHVVSRALRETLVEVGCKNVEFLPIVILNHRGKVASDEYSIANVLGAVDCLDREQSKYKMDALVRTKVDSIEKLVLRVDRIPEDLHLFRLKDRPETHLVSEALKGAIEAKRLTGMVFVPIDEYDSDLNRP